MPDESGAKVAPYAKVKFRLENARKNQDGTGTVKVHYAQIISVRKDGEISAQPHTFIMHANTFIMYALYCFLRQ